MATKFGKAKSVYGGVRRLGFLNFLQLLRDQLEKSG